MDVELLLASGGVVVRWVQEDSAVGSLAIPFGGVCHSRPIAVVDDHISEPFAKGGTILLKALTLATDACRSPHDDGGPVAADPDTLHPGVPSGAFEIVPLRIVDQMSMQPLLLLGEPLGPSLEIKLRSRPIGYSGQIPIVAELCRPKKIRD